MSYVAVRWLSAGTTAVAATMLLAGCAVGPDYVHPAAPEITRYTREPIVVTSSTDTADGRRHYGDAPAEQGNPHTIHRYSIGRAMQYL